MPRRGNIAALRTSRDVSSMISARHHLDQGITFFSLTKFTFLPISSLFRQVGLLFRQVGSLISQSLRSQVSGSPLESRRSDSTASSLPFSSAKFKIAVSLCAAGTQRMVDTCRSEQRRYKFSHCALFKLLTGGAATAGTGGRHVSHGIESRSSFFIAAGGAVYNL